MRPRTLLVLLALVVGLGAFVLLYERDLPSSEERAERAGRALPGLAAGEVTAVEIEAGGRRLRIERQPAPAGGEPKEADEADLETAPRTAWRLVAPLVARADATLVDALLSTLAGLSRVRTLEGVEPAAVGLEVPHLRVRLATAAGERELAVGAAVPATSDVVVAEAGRGAPFVVPAGFLADLERPAEAWRARDLFPGRREAIARLELRGPAGQVVLARDGESWQLVEPLADRADRDLVAALLTDLAGLRAEAFLDAPPGGEAGVGTVLAHLEGAAEPFAVELAGAGESAGRIRARVEGQWVEIAARLAEAVAREPGAWRSRAWSALDSWQVDGLTAEDGAGRTRLERRDGEWRRDGERIAYGPAGDLFYLLAGLRAERFAAPGEEGLAAGAPRLTLELAGPEGGRERLFLYPEREGLVPARAEGRAAVLLLPAAGVADLAGKLAAVRAAAAEEESPPAAATAAPSS